MGSLRRTVHLLAVLECVRICFELLTVVGAVVGGEPAAVGEFPHMALLGRPCSQPAGWPFTTTGSSECVGNEWFCGGSLISNRFVLTAAHCAHTEMQNPPTLVRLGEYDLGDGAEPPDRPHHQDYAIRAIVQHPEYNGILTYNDIALVQLERTVTFSRFIQPACLWAQDTLPDGTPLVATGWGKIGHCKWKVLKSMFTLCLGLRQMTGVVIDKEFGNTAVKQNELSIKK
uniref:Uncharacterized protein n=1 Tax=Anopheles atroparvus TaxID=41427 RepID=A0A182JA43_ANOAO